MYREVYDFIREILNDQQLNEYIVQQTGKHLAVIDAGAQVTAPSVSINLRSGNFTRKANTDTGIDYLLSFAMPFWGADSFTRCLDFIDFVLPIFFEYRDNHMFIRSANPSINELLTETSEMWSINILLSVSALII